MRVLCGRWHRKGPAVGTVRGEVGVRVLGVVQGDARQRGVCCDDAGGALRAPRLLNCAWHHLRVLGGLKHTRNGLKQTPSANT